MRSYQSILKKFPSFLGGVTPYALVGRSGTGKSFRARLLAEKNGIPYIIDDGLLIGNNKILAGHSAKKEPTYMGAIKVALFDDPLHREAVKNCIKKEKVRKILLIGTSVKMVSKMAERLGLPRIKQFIKIEDIASKEEIERAIHSRYNDGKHIIPVPALEVKPDYSHILSDSIKLLFHKNFTFRKKKTQIFEKSVVTPVFANQGTRGKVQISEAALSQMILHCIDEYEHTIEVMKISIKRDKRGYRIAIAVSADYGKHLGGNFHDLQTYVIDKIERFSGIMICSLSIEVGRISKPKRQENQSHTPRTRLLRTELPKRKRKRSSYK